ncbi:hypothetical protein [Nostocoides sp. HKS02]|uniref:hypothetical protein n=1 Tax=Nostocoides sp. HKS02 TaxID=1813880 RepID=UPI0012B44F0E|nr:hypothetical protein [Tetrasphaera sp. HKS02]QGN57072.1 hypothetical protein GKE56_03280 [Tetrasphaera sp. HKS02]
MSEHDQTDDHTDDHTDEQTDPSQTPESPAAAAVSHASKQEDPVADAEGRSGLGPHATGDIVIDAALQDLQNAPSADLDAQIEAGSRVQQTLQSRLSDLGGA